MSQVLEQLVVELKADVKGLQASLEIATRGVRGFERESNQVTESVSRMLSRLRMQVLAVASAWGTFQLGKGFVDAGIQMQALNSKMGAATGSAGIAASAMQFLRDETQRLGLDFRSSADGFASFAASALRSGLTFEETKEIFTGVSEAASGMRLSTERTSLVFMALSQMASKGTVSMEELKQQLGESLPGALQIFAKSMGVGTSEFMKMVEQGQVTARDLIKLGKGLKEEFGGAAQEAATGAQAAFNRFGNAFFELQSKIAESGFLDAVTKAVKDFTAQLQDPSTIDGLKAFAGYLGDIARMAAKAASAIGDTMTHFRDRQTAMRELAAEGKGLPIFRSDDKGGGLFLQNEEAVQERVRTIQLRRDAINAPYKGPAATGFGGLLTGSSGGGLLSGGLGGSSGEDGYTLGKASPPAVTEAAKRAAEMRKRLRDRVGDMTTGLITEGDPSKVDSAKAIAALNKRYEEEQDLLEKALEKKAITDQEFKENSLKVELDYQARLAEIRQQYRDQMISEEQAAAEGFLGIRTDLQDKTTQEEGASFRESISQAAQHNRAFFALEKAAAIARALLAARQTVVDAYRWGNTLGGPIGGAVAASVAAAAQAVNIAAIASTSFGGGGGVSSGGGGGGGSVGGADSGSSAGAVPVGAQKTVNVTLVGSEISTWSKNQIRELMDLINDASADGSKLHVAYA